MESWEDDNFEPPAVAVTPLAVVNKWVGEDEDEDVKDNWEDDDDDDNKKEDDKKVTETKKSKKKSLAEKIAEKEAKKREELEKRLKEEEELSPEERLRIQKESDLKIALETTFGDGDAEDEEIGGLKLPSTKEEFDEFTETLTKKLTPLARHGNEYVNFADNLTRNLCAVMNSSDIKKVKNTLDNLYLEKQKIEKGDKSKKNKGKGKAKLKLESDNQLSAYTDFSNDFDEFENFM